MLLFEKGGPSMLQRKVRKLAIALLTLALSVVVSTQVSAVGESVTIQSFDTMACAPESIGAGIVVHVNGTDAVDIRFSLENLTKTTSSAFTSGILPSGTYDFDIGIPASTAVGDYMSLVIDLLDEGAAVVASDSLDYSCGIVESVPTFSQWGLGLLVLMFIGLAWRRFGLTTG
jgi:hypothetical protein